MELLILLLLVVAMMKGHAERKSVTSTLLGVPVELQLRHIGGGYYLEERAAYSFMSMQAAAKAEDVELHVNDAWRSNSAQAQLRAAYEAGTGALAAREGQSNHEAGMAVDIDMVDEKSGMQRPAKSWMDAHARRFGWRRTVAIEPWHWEFLA